MTQLISIFLEDENGKIIEKSEINFAGIINEAWEIKNFKKDYPWISSIDPYGNTIINIHQAHYLIEELIKINRYLKKNDIDNAIEFIKKIDQHLYVKFIGD